MQEKTTPLINNVNTAEIAKFRALIESDPSKAKKHKVVSGRWVFDAQAPQFKTELDFAKGKVTLNTELPAFAGGWGTSPDPIQYCLSGLAACFAVTLAATASMEGIALKRLEVTAENWMDLRKQMGVSKDNIIERVKFRVLCEGPSRTDQERLVKLAEERCPGTEAVTRSIPLTIELA
jgi:uncharacterized OsmC-like protein